MQPFYKKLTLNHARGFRHNLKQAVYRPVAELSAEYFVTPEPVPFSKIGEHAFRPIREGEHWGKLWDCGWFRLRGELPAAYDPAELVFLLDFSGEGCVFDSLGTPLRGLTNVSSEFDRDQGDPGKRVVPVTEVTNGPAFEFYVETGCNDLFGKYRGGTVGELRVAVCNRELRALYYDYTTLLQLAETLPPDGTHYCKVLYALERAYFALSGDFLPEEIAAARAALAPELARKNPKDTLLEYYAIGHAHMDLAWLWPIRETRRKIGRTFSTVLANMENYPDYVFGASQPQQLAWLKEDYPALFEKLKRRVAEGRVEPQGAMWVEADTNITGGESLIRQILYGKKFFLEEFGVQPSLVWLPDVFGFSAALPQIMKKCGVENFVTIKLSWSEFNTFPHNTFWWESEDGSRVLVHMPPELNYNGAATPESFRLAEKNYTEKGILDKALIVYGIGDGGGGPNRAHLERLERMKDLLDLPKCRQAGSETFFRDLRKNLPPLRTHRGEMYLERHQGTYTTQARNKKYNRLLENLLRQAEYLCTAAKVRRGAPYPGEALETIWKEVLLYQFHDILPGSSIQRVYEESLPRYAALEEKVRFLIKEAQCALGGEQTLWNFSPFPREELVERGGEWFLASLPAMGASAKLTPYANRSVRASANTLENQYLSARFEGGELISLIDKTTGNESVRRGNTLRVYNDFGDAWDMNINYRNSPNGTFTLTEAEPYQNGAEAGIVFRYRYGSSTLTQRVWLNDRSAALVFACEADWQERGKMLRAEFDTAISTDRVTCDIQFGSVRRSTVKNDSREFAQYEICAHKWADLSREDFGVALVNDCKYGYSAEGSLLTLNLLRSTDYPGEGADRGAHTFRYALLPHAGRVETSCVARYAYEFNHPVCSGAGGELSFLSVNCPHVVLETVKLSECGKYAVVRMYENAGVPAEAVLSCPDFSRCRETDMTEKPGKSVPVEAGKVTLSFSPREIKTVLLELRG